MGFFSKLKNKARRQVAPVMPMPPRKTIENAPPAMDLDRIMRGPGMPMAPQAPRPISEMPLTPEQMARKPFPRGRGKRRSIRDLLESLKQRSRERFPNPTIFGQPMPRDMDFSQMPQISPEDMLNLQIPTEMPVMPEERMAPPVINQMQGEPRMMMAGGRDASMVDFLNSDPRQQMFGVETRIGMLENQLQEALANNDRQSYDMIVDQINDADAQRINIMNSMNPTPTIPDPRVDRMIESGMGSSESLDDILSDLEKKN